MGTAPPESSSRRLSLIVWWSLLALVLWLVGQAVDQPVSAVRCAASAALFAVIGEIGDRLRRRLRAGRTGHRRQAS
ncbi:hypothetical protein PV417_16530 [Streptomyces sp. ME19-03-3]|nr:hypothetical protein [Streptomyces sp. ME19-03-3]